MCAECENQLRHSFPLIFGLAGVRMNNELISWENEQIHLLINAFDPLKRINFITRPSFAICIRSRSLPMNGYCQINSIQYIWFVRSQFLDQLTSIFPDVNAIFHLTIRPIEISNDINFHLAQCNLDILMKFCICIHISAKNCIQYSRTRSQMAKTVICTMSAFILVPCQFAGMNNDIQKNQI